MNEFKTNEYRSSYHSYKDQSDLTFLHQFGGVYRVIKDRGNVNGVEPYVSEEQLINLLNSENKIFVTDGRLKLAANFLV